MSSVSNGDRKYYFFFSSLPHRFLFASIHIHVNHEANLWNMQVGNKMKQH